MTATNYLAKHDEYDRQALHWLAESDNPDSIDTTLQCISTAQVYATLAQAAATADLASRGLEVYST